MTKSGSCIGGLPHWPIMIAVPVLLLLMTMGERTLAQNQVTGRLEVKIVDNATGRPTPARVRLTHNGRVVPALPESASAVMYGLWDHADGYGYQPDSSFYVDGGFQLDLPPGDYVISLSKGNEYLAQQQPLHIKKGRKLKKTVHLTRWIDMPARGWYSADDHIHIRRSPREDPLLMDWIQAEDIHVGVLLRMGDFWETYYPQYAWGEKGVYQEGNYMLTSGQEDPRTPELGHAIGIGASDRVRYRDEYYLYDKVFDKLHELGGMTGYAHQAKSFHGYRGLILDGLRGKVDMLELLQFCVSDDPLLTEHYYHMLDLGFPVTAVAGSDFPWCGHDHDSGPPERSARIGNARFYTYINEPLSYQTWKAGLAAGHTFVSSGPIIEFSVNNHIPGDTLHISKGDSLTVRAYAYGHSSQVPLQALEIIGHGQVLGRISPGDSGQSHSQLTLELTLPADHGLWLAGRCYGGPGQAAHTTPVYVRVNGGGFHNPHTVPRYLALSEQYLQELGQELENVTTDPDRQAWRYRAGLERRMEEVRRIIEMLKEQLN